MKDITTEEAVKQVNDFLEGKKIQYGKGYKNNNNFKAIEKVLNVLEKKDKLINAMAKEWFELDELFMIRGKNIHSVDDLKKYFKRKVENV